jgi:hypothetical protein
LSMFRYLSNNFLVLKDKSDGLRKYHVCLQLLCY